MKALKSPSHWVLLGKASALRGATYRKPVKVSVHDRDLVLWQAPDTAELFAMDDACPHRGASLSKGKAEGSCVVCPYHNKRIRAGNGGYPIRVTGDNAWLDWQGAEAMGLPPDELAYPEFSMPGYRTIAYHKDLEGINPVLMTENTLDWNHLAYVHRVHFVEGDPIVTVTKRGLSGMAEYVYDTPPSSALDLTIENEYHAPFTSSLRFRFSDKKTGRGYPPLLLWFSLTPTKAGSVRLHLRIARGVLTAAPCITDALFRLIDELPLFEDIDLVRDIDASTWAANRLTPQDEFVATYRDAMVSIFPGLLDTYIPGKNNFSS